MRKELKVIQDVEDCCPTLPRSTLAAQELDETVKLFTALADPTRVTILNMLSQAQEGEVCVCDITDSFKIHQPTISHHLRILREAGLISGNKRGKWVYYSLVPGKAEGLKTALEMVFRGAPVLAG